MKQIIACALFATSAALLVSMMRVRIGRLNKVTTAGFRRLFFPSLLGNHRESERLRGLDLELIDSLGEMVMGLEAGLSFEAVLDA